MNQNTFQSWIEGIYDSGKAEIDCHQLQEVLPAYIEAVIHSQPLDQQARNMVETHLRYCPDCHEISAGLKYVVTFDEEVDMETAVSLPPVPDLTAVPHQ